MINKTETVMKISYQCELCLSRYETEAEALECENQPKRFLPPLGMIYQYNDEIFMVVVKSRLERHFLSGGTWAARDTPTGDNNEGETCGLELAMKDYYSVKNRQSKAFKRCVEYCQKHGWTPTVFDGTQAASL